MNPFEDAPVVNGTSFDENSFAARLIQRGSNTDAPDTVTGKPEVCISLQMEGLCVNCLMLTALGGAARGFSSICSIINARW